MKKRLITLAIVVLFALTMVPFVAVADANLIEISSDPAGVDAPDSHWGWSSREGIDTLPANMRGITGIIIEFDIEPGAVEFVVQSQADWWDHPGATEFDGNTLEINFADFTENAPWELHSKQYEVHLVFGNWDDAVTPANVVGAWLIGEDLGAPQFEPGDENPVLAAPTVDDFGGHDHWGWSMENGSLPWNMSEITGIVIEFDTEPGALEFVIQSPVGGWWDHPGATAFDGNTLEINFADFSADWDEHAQQNEMHLVIGNWDAMRPENVVSAQLIGVVAEGIPNPEAGPAVELPPDGSLPFDIGVGAAIWGDVDNQLGWNGDTRAIDGGAPLDGGGLTAGLLAQAQWFVIYVDNSPDDYEHEMVEFMIFGNANGWSWEGGSMSYPTVGVYNTFVPGAIAIPLQGHPYIDAIQAIGEDEFANRNFGIMFQYGGGIASLGITSVMIYDALPGAAEPAEPEPPAATPEPPAPEETPEPPPAPEPETGGVPVWGWVLIAVGGAAVVVVIVVVALKKGKKA